MVRYKNPGQRGVLPQIRLIGQLPTWEEPKHHKTRGGLSHHLCCGQQRVCQSSALLPKSSWWQSAVPWGGSIAWAGGLGRSAGWRQPRAVAPCPCHHLPPPPGSPRCFSCSSVRNAVAAWKQTACTPSPPGTGCMARRDTLVSGCLDL